MLVGPANYGSTPMPYPMFGMGGGGMGNGFGDGAWIILLIIVLLAAGGGWAIRTVVDLASRSLSTTAAAPCSVGSTRLLLCPA